jgi:hypothetical protein
MSSQEIEQAESSKQFNSFENDEKMTIKTFNTAT